MLNPFVYYNSLVFGSNVEFFHSFLMNDVQLKIIVLKGQK
jgi:hypothetical protein